MVDELIFDFCNMYIYDNYLIVVMKEGVTIMPSHNQVLLNVVDTYFKNKRFVYITHRINSYSVDPAVYFETSKIENLEGFAVVSKDFKAKSNAEIEKLFLNKPFEVFDTLEEAVTWAKTIIV
ncbi:hypothetical protein M0G43_09855 [Subsaxibacter sp. CAU 1640]|uniref:hypothetical protein n=1 Tax=Subsaxibacter sp. CAU 1640 TaxID=2933271 RepID=UPI002005EAEA|nr:hypothetical protein [Subsaxibacter sp. CAU 1640]MCK7590877.1 hypothetical protein [Subsaxibacter sp. CAU 1640]